MTPPPEIPEGPDGRSLGARMLCLHYRDLAAAAAFYEEVLGMALVADHGWLRVYEMGVGRYIGLVGALDDLERAAALEDPLAPGDGA